MNGITKQSTIKRLLLCVWFFFFIFLFIFGDFFPIPQNKSFIVGVDPRAKKIIATEENRNLFVNIFSSVAQTTLEYITNNSLLFLATIHPSQTSLSISPGMRREEIVSLLSKKLLWNESEVKKFLNVKTFLKIKDAEGFYYPGTYLVSPDMPGDEVARMMIERFSEKIISLYGTSTQEIIDLPTAVKIASIIEREAGGKHDMRLISGIIWNRLFANMSLDIDATLQYAKGTEKNWWPKVNPEDKYINSPFNTYQNKGLTPTPIANPGRASIEAALNPRKTDCLFYLHDKYRRIHCAVTYKEHEKNIARYYGR